MVPLDAAAAAAFVLQGPIRAGGVGAGMVGGM